jgi:hypothetical protein
VREEVFERSEQERSEADGRFLMNITVEETTSPIAIILNWKLR